MQRFRRLSMPFIQTSKLKTNHDCTLEDTSSSHANAIPSSSRVKPSSRKSATTRMFSRDVNTSATRDTLSDSEAVPGSATSLTKRRRRLTKRKHSSKKPVPQPPSSEILDIENRNMAQPESSTHSPGLVLLASPTCRSVEAASDLINELQEPPSNESFLTSVFPNPLEASSVMSPSSSSPAPLSVILEQDERSIRARTPPNLNSHPAFGSITSQGYSDRISSVKKEGNRTSVDNDPTTSDTPRLSAATKVSEISPSLDLRYTQIPRAHITIPNKSHTAGSDFPSTMVSPTRLPFPLVIPPLTPETLIPMTLISSSDSPPSPAETTASEAYDTAVSTFGAEDEENSKETLVLSSEAPKSIMREQLMGIHHSDNDSCSSSAERWSTPTPTLRTVDADLDTQLHETGIVRGNNNLQEQNTRMVPPISEGDDEIFLIPVEELWGKYRLECQAGSSITRHDRNIPNSNYGIVSKPRVPADHAPQSAPENQDTVGKQNLSSYSPVFPPGLGQSRSAANGYIMLENQFGEEKSVYPSEITELSHGNTLYTSENAIDSSAVEVQQPWKISLKVDKEVQTTNTTSDTRTVPNSVTAMTHPPSNAIALESHVDHGTANGTTISPSISHIKEDYALTDEYQPSPDMKSTTANEMPSSQDSSTISVYDIQTNTNQSVVLQPVEELLRNYDKGIFGVDVQLDSNDHSSSSLSLLPPTDTFISGLNDNSEHQSQEPGAVREHSPLPSSGSLVLTPVEVLWQNRLPPGAAAPTDIEPVTSSIIDALKTAMALSPAAKVPSTLMMSSSSISGRSTPGGLPEIRESEEEHEADGSLSIKARSSKASLQDARNMPQVENNINPAICQRGKVTLVNMDTSNQDDSTSNKMQQSFQSSSICATSLAPILTQTSNFEYNDNIDIQQSVLPSSSSPSSSGIIAIQRITDESPSSPVFMPTLASRSVPHSASSSMATASTFQSSNSASHSISSTTPLNDATETPRAQTTSLFRSFSSLTRSISISTRSRSFNILRKREPNFNMISAEEYLGLVGTGWGIEPWNGRNSGVGSLALVRALEQTMRSRSLDSPIERGTSANVSGGLLTGEIVGGMSQIPPVASQMNTIPSQSSREVPASSRQRTQSITFQESKRLSPFQTKFGQPLRKLSKHRKIGTKQEVQGLS